MLCSNDVDRLILYYILRQHTEKIAGSAKIMTGHAYLRFPEDCFGQLAIGYILASAYTIIRKHEAEDMLHHCC